MNKFVHTYVETFQKSAILNPSIETSILGASTGAGLGAVADLIMGPEYDKQTGKKTSPILTSLKRIIGGAGIGYFAPTALNIGTDAIRQGLKEK